MRKDDIIHKVFLLILYTVDSNGQFYGDEESIVATMGLILRINPFPSFKLLMIRSLSSSSPYTPHGSLLSQRFLNIFLSTPVLETTHPPSSTFVTNQLVNQLGSQINRNPKLYTQVIKALFFWLLYARGPPQINGRIKFLGAAYQNK